MKEERRGLFHGLGMWFVVLSATAFYGCTFSGGNEEGMTRDTPSSVRKSTHSVMFPRYPYPPEDLWRRLVDVIKTHPDKLTYLEFGRILGIEFDEEKMKWYGDRASGKYFWLSTSDIKNARDFPFGQIRLSQEAPYTYNNEQRRVMAFDFDLFDHKHGELALIDDSEIYCIRPRFPDLEAQGYRYDELRSSMPPPTDRKGIPVLTHYSQKIFVDDVDSKSIAHKQVILKVLGNGCLVGIFYFNSPQY